MRFRLTIFFLSFLLLFSIGNSFSQTDEPYKATIKELFRVSHSNETFDVVIKQMFSLFKGQFTNVPEEIWDELEQEFTKASMNDLVDMLVPIYSKYLTIADVNELIKFYESPVGKKYAENNPLIVQESMQVGQQWGQKIGAEFTKKMQEKGY